jgi:hypothetical protein
MSLAERRRVPTLQSRVSALGVVVIAGWLIALIAGFDIILGAQLRQQADATLQARAEAAASTVLRSADGTVSVVETDSDTALDTSIWVYDGPRAVERGSGPPVVQAAANLCAAAPGSYGTTGAVRFYSMPVARNSVLIATVVASISLAPYDAATTTAVVGTALLAALTVIGAYAVLRLAAARALRPVQTMSAQGAAWAEHAREADLLLLRSPNCEAATAIRAAAESMQAILQTLLSTAQLDNGRLPGTCSLSAILSDTDLVTPPTVTIDPATHLVGVDGAVLARILTPILDNADRYAHTAISISAWRAGSAIAIDIHSDGPRIAQDLHERVFEPGFRAAPNDEHDGTGLGLPLARRLARAADGDVTRQETATPRAVAARPVDSRQRHAPSPAAVLTPIPRSMVLPPRGWRSCCCSSLP